MSDDVERYVRASWRRRARIGTAIRIFNAALIALGLGVATFVGCNGCEANTDDVLDTLKANDLADPRLDGAAFGACAETESSRRFTATTARGKRVSGIVCCGRFAKGCTLRW